MPQRATRTGQIEQPRQSNLLRRPAKRLARCDVRRLQSQLRTSIDGLPTETRDERRDIHEPL